VRGCNHVKACWIDLLGLALFVVVAAVCLHRKIERSSMIQKQRVAELWKEFDTHARYCPCLKREWPVVEGETEEQR
jgi:hypothetical protein